MKTSVFAARLTDYEEVEKSSSGGMFTAISDYFLEKEYAIISSVYNFETNQTEYHLYEDVATRNMARGSKYMQSIPLNSFFEAEKWLKKNDGKVLFVGMGCQAEAFRKYSELKHFRNRTIIVDIICHGSSSPKLWKEFANLHGDFSKIEFRNKRNGWARPTSFIIKNGKEIDISNYMKLFYSRCALRPACYKCPYATTERKVDITIGDFWGIEKAVPSFNISNGVSLVLIHTEQGMDIWNNVKEKLEWAESNIKDCLQPNLVQPTIKSPEREKFWNIYYKFGIRKLLKRFGRDPFIIRLKNKVKAFIKKVLKKLKII